MNLLRRHGPFVTLLAVVTALLVGYSWHPGVASFGDDSVSYLILARYFAGLADPLLAPWVGYQLHFPPLYPLLLAAIGGARDLLVANLATGLLAAAALVAVYAHASRVLGGTFAGFAVVAVFVTLPTAWVSVRGIVTEPLYLALSMAFLALHASRLEGARWRLRDALLAGVLLGAAWLTRSAAAALVAAFVAHVAVGFLRTREHAFLRAAWPLAVATPMAIAWIALRPEPLSNEYAAVMDRVVSWISADPAGFAAAAARRAWQGWIAGFTMSSDVGLVAQALAAVLGVAGVAGALARAWQNRIDGYYVLAAIAMLFLWPHSEDQMRRLWYPFVPPMLMMAAWLAQRGIARIGAERMRRVAWGAMVAIPLLLALPATLMVAERARLRDPVLPPAPYALAGMKELYTVIRTREARALAANAIAMLAGLEALQRSTPVGARVMWMRPEYVALLGNRAGVPWYYSEGLDGLLVRAYDGKVDYIVAANLYKADLRGEQLDRFDDFEVLKTFATPVLAVPNAELGINDFVLLAVDPAKLATLIETRGARASR